MNSKLSLSLLVAILTFSVAIATKAEDKVRVIRLGPDQQRVEIISTRLGETGDWITETNGYSELGTGLNYWDSKSEQWESSAEEIELRQVGAAALRAPHKVYFAPSLDDPQGAVDVLAPDGSRFRSSVLALGYYDPVSGRRHTLGLVKDVPGELLPPNQVIYRDAFASQEPGFRIRCDVLYTFRRSGIEQDILMREPVPPPEDFGLSADRARLEVMTEFFEAPEPKRHARLLDRVENSQDRAVMASPDWEDESLDFGQFLIGDGRGFRLGRQADVFSDGPNAPLVAKRWVVQEGRRVLLEAVRYSDVEPMLRELAVGPVGSLQVPPNGVAKPKAGGGIRPSSEGRPQESMSTRSYNVALGTGSFLPRRPATSSQHAGRTMAMARRGVDTSPAVVLDYVMLLVDTNNFTFRGDETYHISSMINLGGTTTLEGGAVIKYAKWNGAWPYMQINITGPFTCATSAYRPAVFTAADDQSVGQWITNSAASPDATASYALHGLLFMTVADQVTLEHVRFRHANHALLFNGRHGNVRHAQFQHCTYPIWSSGYKNTVRAHNILAIDMMAGGAAFRTVNNAHIITEHATVCNSANLYSKDGSADATLFARNSIFAGIGSYIPYVGDDDLAYGNLEWPSTNGLFQTIGAANYYLADPSAHRDAGVQSIEGALAVDLTGMTTYPPLLLTNDFTTNTLLTMRPIRDTNVPDRGYHYPALDYCLASRNLTNCTLTLSNGVAVGVYGPKGIILRQYAKLASEGEPGLLNRLVRYNTVQEQSTNWGSASTNAFSFLEVNSSGVALPSVSMRYTDVSHLAITTNSTTARRFLWAGSGSSTQVRPIALSHCQLRGVNFEVSYAGSEPQSVALTNNLFEGSVATFFEQSGNGSYTLTALNNLFFRGKVTFDNSDSGSSWTIRDNLFDADVATSAGYSTASNNGFRAGLGSFGSSAKTALLTDFVPGPLGRFYYPTTGAGGSLTNLFNAGSQNANSIGMFHFTCRADQQKEANSVVDIGFHYPANSWSNSRVAFVGTDTTTQGNWKGVYGADGYHITYDSTNLPPYISSHTNSWIVSGVGTYWTSSTTDPRALLRAGAGRMASGLSSTVTTAESITITSSKPVRLAVYCLDWDGLNRAQTVQIRDYFGSDTYIEGSVMDSRSISNFTGGVWLVWDVVGSIVLRINNSPGSPGCIRSGVFFGPAPTPSALDSDGDGITDFQEDPNGNGTVDTGESSPTDVDSDYDGRSDMEERAEGTNPTNPLSLKATRLLALDFNTTTNAWRGSNGALPIETNSIALVQTLGHPDYGVAITNTNAVLRFRDVEPNGAANINCRQGTIEFGFSPYWASSASVCTNGDGGSGPGVPVRLLSIGDFSIEIGTAGTNVMLRSPNGSGGIITNAQGPLSLCTGTAPPDFPKAIRVVYSTNASAIFFDGRRIADGTGIQAWPSPAARASGVFIGTSTNRTAQVNGIIDHVQTWNYPFGLCTNAWLLSATVTNSPPRITLNWNGHTNCIYKVERRLHGQTNWSILGSVTGTSYPDSTIVLAQEYEYRASADVLYASELAIVPDPSVVTLTTGVLLPPNESPGHLILIVDRTKTNDVAYAGAITNLIRDLWSEGWVVTRFNGPRHDDVTWANNPSRIAETLGFITNYYNSYPTQSKAVLLFGHLPIPHSGMLNPDGHPARDLPADCRYGDIDGIWTDGYTWPLPNQDVRIEPGHSNVAGDGKYDQTFVPANSAGRAALELAIGRVDFANLPAFTNGVSPRGEVDLLAQYASKAKWFRRRSVTVPDKIVFGSYLNYDPVGESADRYSGLTAKYSRRLAAASFGTDTTGLVNQDFLVANLPAVWGILAGKAGGGNIIHNNADINAYYGKQPFQTTQLVPASGEPPIAFSTVFCSWAPDWADADHLCRALLATRTNGLAWSYLGDKFITWQYQILSLGKSLGEGYLKAHRDAWEWPAYTAPHDSVSQLIAPGSPSQGAFIAASLLGDPTLRMLPPSPPGSLMISTNGSSQVLLTWPPSPDSGATYFVYRSMEGIGGNWTRLTASPIVSNAWLDTTPPLGERKYLVRSLVPRTTMSGSFTNISAGSLWP